MQETIDDHLIERCREGNETAWGSLYSRMFPIVLRFALARGVNVGDANDVAQDTLIAVYSQIDRYEMREGIGCESWIWGIARNKVADYFRARGRRGALEEYVNGDCPDQVSTSELDEWTSKRLFAACLKPLDSQERDILRLKYVEALSWKEIREQLPDCPVNGTETLRRIHSKIRRYLENRGGRKNENL